MRVPSYEFDATHPVFWDLYAGKVLFFLKAHKKAGSKTEIYIHIMLVGAKR